MTEFFTWIMNFVREFKFLIIVLPWEAVIRVRLGKHIALLPPGWHVRLPFIDTVQSLNTRLRVAATGGQTLTTRDGHALTVALSVGFHIHDPFGAMMRMHHPETTCASLAASYVSAIVCAANRADLTPTQIENAVHGMLATEAGYTFEFVRVTDFAYARTYRLLNDNFYRGSGVTIEERKL